MATVERPIWVKELMTPAPLTVPPGMSLADARALMTKRGIRHLLVTGEAGELIGIVTDRDVRRALPSPVTSLSIWEVNDLLGKVTVEEVMTRGRLIGILTETDLLKAFAAGA